MSKPSPVVPDSMSIRDALSQSQALAVLQARIRESEACLRCALTVLPTGLRAHIKAGSWDEGAWTLLATNAAVASKLRHLEPVIQAALHSGGLHVSAIRIKVQAVKTG